MLEKLDQVILFKQRKIVSNSIMGPAVLECERKSHIPIGQKRFYGMDWTFKQKSFFIGTNISDIL